MQIQGLKNVKVCLSPKNRFALSNVGERALVSHMKGKKHIQDIQNNVQDSSQPKVNRVLIKLQFLMSKVSVAWLTFRVSRQRQWMILYIIRKMLQMRKSFRLWRIFSLNFIEVLWKFAKIVSEHVPRQWNSQEFYIQ